MLIDEIKKANMQALKDRNKASRAALSILISKYMLLNVENKAQEKETSDADVGLLVQKTVKELEEEKFMYVQADRPDKVAEMDIQIQAVSKYLPAMMSTEEIAEIIDELPDKTIKTVMSYFKQNYAGRVDMTKVSQILKTRS